MSTLTKQQQLKYLISISIATGVLTGMASNFFGPGNVQTLLWGLNAFFSIIGASLLASKLGRDNHDIPAAGFAIFTIANAMIYAFLATHDTGDEQFGASIMIYTPALILISLSDISHIIFRIMGFIAAIAFGIHAMMIFLESNSEKTIGLLTGISYPFMSIVLIAWSWRVYKERV